MSPYTIHDYPAWAAFLVRVARTALYTCSVSTGACAIIFTPASLQKAGAGVIVGSMLIFGLVCLVGVLWQKYIIEWISLFFLSAGMSIYVAAVWISSINRPEVIAGASMFTMLVLFLIIRLIDLTVYWLRNFTAAKLNREMSNE